MGYRVSSCPDDLPNGIVQYEKEIKDTACYCETGPGAVVGEGAAGRIR